ncbi:hypothetical protein R1flu_022194 [Riccia fluitans]|uniref:Uncharacterized protein n=1 Tax=Riccia fluitans TaxID=41844 RepID=A0ABD1ZSU3_9MARC
MAAVRVSFRMAESLIERANEAINEVVLQRETDENCPMLGSASAQERAAVLRPSPRLLLKDITHLFPSNGANWNDSTRNGVLTGRIRRRTTEIPGFSKKRRISDVPYPVWDTLSRPACKSRGSTGIRSFR